MALRVQGISSCERAACALGSDPDTVAARLADLAARELAAERTGRLAGFTLSPNGIERLDELLAAEGLRTNEVVQGCYDRFLGLNKRVLKVSSDWQVRREGGVEEPNDHSDPSYDEAVIERLAQLHDSARACVEGVARCAPRFGPYADRLEGCVKRLQAGDRSAFTAPLAESYHTVWFELHQDLLLTLGLEREE